MAARESRCRPIGSRTTSIQPPEQLGSLAVFAAPVRSRLDGGAHTIFILDVAAARAGDADPLLSFERVVRKLG